LNEGDVLPSVERTITQERIAKYAAASGDFNPIHVDEAFAADSQFGGTIAHGMLVAAAVSEVMSAAFGLDWLDGGRLKLRFRAPVFPGDTITAYGVVKAVGEGEVTGEVVCSVGVRRQTGEDAITGEARVRVRR
jgi:3-hydroxybutyryl-CoA dehydratase